MATENPYEGVPSDKRNVHPNEHHEDYLRRMVEGSRHDAWNEGDANGDERGYARGKADRYEQIKRQRTEIDSQKQIVSGLVEAARKITTLGYMTSEDAGNLTLLVEETEIEELLYDLRQAIAKGIGE